MNDDSSTDSTSVNIEVVAFNYEAVEPENRKMIESHTQAIKARLRRTTQDIIEIGEMLADVKEYLLHGQFTLWLQIKFGWDVRSAQRFMSVAKLFKNDKLSFLAEEDLDKLAIAVSALYELAQPSTPEQARQEVVERAVAGEVMSHAKVKRIVQERKIKPAVDLAVGSDVEVVVRWNLCSVRILYNII